MNKTLQYGLSAGAIMSIIMIVLHYVSFELSQSASLSFLISFVVPIVFMVLGVKAKRVSQEGYISFGEGLMTSFFIYMIAAILSTVVSFGFMQTFDDATWQKVADSQKESAAGMMEMFGVENAEVEEAFDEQFDVDAIKEATSSPFILLIGILGSAFVGLLISLVLSAIMKRNPVP